MNYQYNYPYNAPQNLIKPKYRAPMFTKIFAIICAVLSTFGVLYTLRYGVDFEILVYGVCLASSVTMIVSLFTGKGLLFAISSFLLALFNISYICYNIYYILTYVYAYTSWIFSNISYHFYILESVLLILIGLHFILKGKVINSLAKMIFAIVYGSLQLLLDLVNFITALEILNHWDSPALRLGSILIGFTFTTLVTFILIFFNPYKKPKQPKMQQ